MKNFKKYITLQKTDTALFQAIPCIRGNPKHIEYWKINTLESKKRIINTFKNFHKIFIPKLSQLLKDKQLKMEDIKIIIQPIRWYYLNRYKIAKWEKTHSRWIRSKWVKYDPIAENLFDFNTKSLIPPTNLLDVNSNIFAYILFKKLLYQFEIIYKTLYPYPIEQYALGKHKKVRYRPNNDKFLYHEFTDSEDEMHIPSPSDPFYNIEPPIVLKIEKTPPKIWAPEDDYIKEDRNNPRWWWFNIPIIRFSTQIRFEILLPKKFENSNLKTKLFKL